MTTKTKLKYKTFILVAIFSLLIALASVSMAQETTDPSKQTTQQSADQVRENTQKQPKTQSSMTGVGSTTSNQDEGYGIIAIRRINKTYKRILNRVATYTTVSEVDIELRVPSIPELTDNLEFIIIGNKAFLGYGQCSSDNEQCIKLRLTTDEFEQLNDNSIVSLYMGKPNEVLKEMYKNGEPREVLGIKFGRLNKQLINQFPIIEMPVVTVH